PVAGGRARLVRLGLAGGLLLAILGPLTGLGGPWWAAPAVAAVWLLHPALAGRSLLRRPARRADGSLAYWWLAIGVAPILALLMAASGWSAAPSIPILLGWLALWGWAGAVVHGMLTRIVPFLVWFHRFSPLAGKVPV